MIHDMNEHYGLEPNPMVPYDRVVDEDGQVLRIETDGMGGIREIPEGRQAPVEYGMRIGVSWTMRDRLDERAAELHNTDLSLLEVAALVVDRLEAGPATSDELAEHVGVWRHQMQHAMSALRRQRKVRCEPDAKAGFRKYMWSLST